MNFPILMYHHVEKEPSGYSYALTVDVFAEQMAALRRWGYEAISFRRLFRALRGEEHLHPKPVILTFDDGYASLADHVAPILRSEGLSATVFVPADAIGKKNTWDAGKGFPELPILDAETLQDLMGNGWELGAHGCEHRDLSKIAAEERIVEACRSKAMLERQFGQEILVFSYPFGVCTPDMPQILKSAGYSGAVSIFSPARSVTSDPFQMRRVYVHRRDSLTRLYMKLTKSYLTFRAWNDHRTLRRRGL